MTSAQIAARLAMLDAILAAFEGQKVVTNAANTTLNAAIRAGDNALAPIAGKATDVVLALNVYKPLLLAERAATLAMVPSNRVLSIETQPDVRMRGKAKVLAKLLIAR